LPQLRGRVGRVVVVPSARPSALRVTVGGHDLSAAVLDVPYVVTPGSVAIEASAPGFQTFRRTVEVSAGAQVRVEVVLAPDPGAAARGEPASGSSATAHPGGSGASGGPGSSTAAAVSARGGTHTVVNPVGPVLMGLGAAGLITAWVTWLLGDGSVSSAQRCVAMRNCTTDNATMASQIETLDTVTTSALIGGGALVVVGGILTFALLRTERTPEAPRPAVSFTLSPRGLGLAGTF
jgi:hypothetical protein